MRSNLTLALFTIATVASAQQCSWLTSAPVEYTLNPSFANEVLASAPGHLVLGRQTTGVFAFGLTLYGEAMLELLDPNDGSQQWSCALFDSVNVECAAVSADGKAYFAGRFMGTLGLCDGSLLAGVPGQTLWHENLFIIAVDLNTGLLEWTRNLSITHDNASGVASMAIDPQGQLWYAISEWGVGKAVRVDENGTDVETRVVDGVRLIGTISFDPWGGMYMGGSSDNFGFAFGGQAFTDPGTTGYSMFVLRYKADGTAGFVKFAEDGTFHDPTVVATNDGYAYLAGSTFSESAWDEFELHGPNWGGDVFIAKLDSTGDFQWVVESAPVAGAPIVGDVDRASGPCIAVDADNNVFFMGDLRGMVDWGNGVISQVGVPTDHGQTIVAFDPSGTAQWAATSSAAVNFAGARSITASAVDGALHFASHLRDTFTFSPLTTNTDGDQAAAFGQLSGLSTGIRSVARGQELVATPNPTSDRTFVQWNENKPMNAELLNSAGQRVALTTLYQGRNAIQVGGLAQGLYLLRLADGRAVRVVKE